jgi:hypothetical protein
MNAMREGEKRSLRNNRVFALCYRSVALVACIVGILDTMGVFRGSVNFEILLFYTTDSNVLVALMLGALLIRTALDIKNKGAVGSASHWERLSAIVMLSITVTMLIFWVLLASTITDMGFLLSYSNLQIHLITPLLMIFDYFFFATPGKLKKRDPWFFALIPLVYFAQATVRGFSGYVYATLSQDGIDRHFPYFFIDFDQLQGGVFVYVFAILVFFVGLAYLFFWYDHRRARRLRRRAKSRVGNSPQSGAL